MNTEDIQSCSYCGVMIDTSILKLSNIYPEGTDGFSDRLKNENNKKGYYYRINYGRTYFVCPICNNVTELND